VPLENFGRNKIEIRKIILWNSVKTNVGTQINFLVIPLSSSEDKTSLHNTLKPTYYESIFDTNALQRFSMRRESTYFQTVDPCEAVDKKDMK
jgi:hypothetical protein